MLSGLEFEATGGSVVYTLLFVQLFSSRTLSRCKHDMGALSWLNAATLERAPTPFFDGLDGLMSMQWMTLHLGVPFFQGNVIVHATYIV